MSVEEAGAGKWGENARVRILCIILYYFKCTFLGTYVKGKFTFLCFVY